jgi:hypothetical protein
MPSEMTKKQVHGTDSVSHSFDEFQLFPKFPIELCLATWALAVPERNTITLISVIGDNLKLVRDWRGDQIVAKASYKVPALLHANHINPKPHQRIEPVPWICGLSIARYEERLQSLKDLFLH